MASRSRVEKELEQLEALVGRGEIDEARMVVTLGDGYPFKAPGVSFALTTIPYHPNICPTTGGVCMDILLNQEMWSPIMSVEKVCVAVLSLLTDANPDHGLNSDALDFFDGKGILLMRAASLALSITNFGRDLYWMASITTSLAGDKHEILLIALNRPSMRNAIDRPMADALYPTLKDFDENKSARVAIIHGCGKDFCAGADLSSISKRENEAPAISIEEDKSPLGCELGLCGSVQAMLGLFGVPLVDGGTINLPSLIGHSRAMDMARGPTVLTGRAVEAEEAVRWGLATRMVERTEDLVPEAIKLATIIAGFPQHCMQSDRLGLLDARLQTIDLCIL
ncbi:Enoyl-CoA hydratase [Perkinsus olseni]|uniref:Enoyl-CoA hydratase n=1 Tax=Perkinsus olseni TaxID=32597 RepID=A0A7J6U6V7_PEROL|nr:Enoyl-CoA hydratase [Perkinsus olseni]